MYHQITLNMLVMTDNPPEPTLEALTLFLMEQPKCIVDVTVKPLVAQCDAMPFTRQPQQPVSNISNNKPIVPQPSQSPPVSLREQTDPSPSTSTTEPSSDSSVERSDKPISKLIKMCTKSERIASIVREPGHKYHRYYSHNGSWLSVRGNGRHYYYDTVHNRRGETNRPIRFRLATGEIETLYTAYNYIRHANKFAMGTRDNRRAGYHIWLTRTEAQAIRKHRNGS